jgi:ribosomal protein S4
MFLRAARLCARPAWKIIPVPRKRESDFTRQLRAKQKARRIYGLYERQFHRYYQVSLKRRGLTGLNLLQILESRLDNVVYRLGFASSRAEARLLVTHGHFSVNGRRTDVPSMLLSPGDEVPSEMVLANGNTSKTWKLWLKTGLSRIGCRVT